MRGLYNYRASMYLYCMTKQDKRTYLHKWHRFQQTKENQFTPKFTKALKQQIRQYAERGMITSAPVYAVLVELYRTVGPQWAAATGVHRLRQSKARMPMGFSERIIELMRRYYGIDLLNNAEGITNTTRDIIQKVLGDAAITGQSINDIVRALEESPELSQMRARRIARTETTAAANTASLINAKESGVPMRKIWLAVHDKRTRHSHRNVDEVKINIDDSFNVGGSQMMQPGVRKQPNGLPVPADQLVNCRCTLGYEVIE